jgi:hypothetical protein
VLDYFHLSTACADGSGDEAGMAPCHFVVRYPCSVAPILLSQSEAFTLLAIVCFIAVLVVAIIFPAAPQATEQYISRRIGVGIGVVTWHTKCPLWILLPMLHPAVAIENFYDHTNTSATPDLPKFCHTLIPSSDPIYPSVEKICEVRGAIHAAFTRAVLMQHVKLPF